jgi:hypothetical protein
MKKALKAMYRIKDHCLIRQSRHTRPMTLPRPKSWQQRPIWTIEHIEQPIGKDLSDQGESLLREKLRAQIDGNAPVEETKQTISGINMVLDKAEGLLKSRAHLYPLPHYP